MQRSGLREQSTIALLLLCDVAWAIAAYAIAFFLRINFPLPFTTDLLPLARVFELRHMLPEIVLAELVTLYFFGFYDLRALRAGFRPIVNSVTALFIHLLATTALYFFSGDVNFPRSVLIVYWLVNAAGLAAIREVVGRRLAASSPTRVLLVGTGEEIEQFLEGVGEPRLHHVDIVGAVAVAGDTSGNGHTPAPFVGGLPWLGERRRPAAAPGRARRRGDRAAVAALVARSSRRPHAAPGAAAARQRRAVGVRHPGRARVVGPHPRHPGRRGGEEPAGRPRIPLQAHHRLPDRRDPGARRVAVRRSSPPSP